MKLFFSPGACSLSPHIVMHELGMKHDLEKVNLKTHQSKTGDFTKQNHKGYVPALLLDNGELLTEGVAIVQYLADQKPEAKMIPKAGTWERYRAVEWLNYISTEIHKGFSPLFHPDVVSSPEAQNELTTAVKAKLAKRFDFLEEALRKNKFIMGDQFTVVDAYLYTVMSWVIPLKVDLSKWPKLMGFVETVRSRPSVASAHEMEKKTT